MGAMLAPIEPAFAEASSFIEATLDALLPKPSGPEARLLEAMRYAALALGGGKRLRAFLVLQSGRLFAVDRRALGRVAAAVECVRAYALVHDDLPAIDDCDVPQGKPPLHEAFNEVIAVLAGDSLLTLAFGLLASPEAHGDPFVRCELIARLASVSGHSGMIGGQTMDVAFEGTTPPLPEITRLARMKTAALITFCCEAGPIMGKASSAARQAMSAYGQELGLAYQIANELSDGKAEVSTSGKTRATVVSMLGSERARAQAQALVTQAAGHLDLFDEKADLLRAAAQFVILSKS